MDALERNADIQREPAVDMTYSLRGTLRSNDQIRFESVQDSDVLQFPRRKHNLQLAAQRKAQRFRPQSTLT